MLIKIIVTVNKRTNDDLTDPKSKVEFKKIIASATEINVNVSLMIEEY